MDVASEVSQEIFRLLLFFVGFGGLSAVIGLLSWQSAISKAYKRNVPWLMEFGDRIGLKLIEPKKQKHLVKLPLLEGTYKGHLVRVLLHHVRGPNCATSIEIPVSRTDGLRLSVVRRNALELAALPIGKSSALDPEKKTGEASFDAKFRLRSNQTERVLNLLDEQTLKQIAYHEDNGKF